MVVQDNHFEADPLVNMPRGMVHVTGSERRLFSYPGSPPSQMILEIRIWGGGVPIQGPPFWAVPGSQHYYAMHGCSSLPSATDRNPHPQLSRRLAHSGSVRRQFQHCTRPSSSATYVAWGSGSTLPRAYCHPANEYHSWGQLSTQCRWQQLSQRNKPRQFSAMWLPSRKGPPACSRLSRRCWENLPEKQGLLRIWPIQFWLKQRVSSAAWRHGCHSITVTRACVSALARWRDLLWLKQRVILDTAHRRKVVTTDASNKGWGAPCEGKPAFGFRSEEELGLHINCLEILAVCHACQFFLPDIRGHHVLVRSDSRSVMSYINHQGGFVSKRLCTLANDLHFWAQNNLRSLKVTMVSTARLMGPTCVATQRENFNLQEHVLSNIAEARAPSTRLFSMLWNGLFSRLGVTTAT